MCPSRSFDPTPEVSKLREYLASEGWKYYPINSSNNHYQEDIDDLAGEEEHSLVLRFEKGVYSIEVTQSGDIIEADCPEELHSLISEILLGNKI